MSNVRTITMNFQLSAKYEWCPHYYDEYSLKSKGHADNLLMCLISKGQKEMFITAFPYE